MSDSTQNDSARKAPKFKLVTALAVLAAMALVLVFAIKPFSSSDAAAAKPSSDDPYAINFDGDSFSGKGATNTGAATVKTEPVAQRDSEEKYASACKSCAKKHRIAMMPAASTTTKIAAGAASAAEIKKAAKEQYSSGKGVELGSDGQAKPPIDAPEAVKNVIAAGNTITNFPYIWGGGHASFQANGYDCSGSVSYALKGANLVDEPMVSGDFMNYGEPGPGKWITIYSSPGHVFMFVGGLRYDTSFRDGPYGTRWNADKRSLSGFAVTHPVGL